MNKMKEKLFVSGYTKKNNKGIHCIEIAKNKEAQSEDNISVDIDSKLLIEIDNPSFIAVAKDAEMIFSVTSSLGGGVCSFIKKNDEYELVGCVENIGKSPSHLFYDESRNFLYASNYHLGKVDIIRVNSLGELKLINTIVIEGKSLISPDQDVSRCHMAITDPKGNFLSVVNLGTDCVYVYDIGEEGGATLVSEYHTLKGMGPRHIAFDFESKFAYLLGELNSQIDILSYNSVAGEFSYVESISMLPEGYYGKNTASAIKISADGKYLYASNRGHDSISVYNIKDNGLLELVQIEKTGGKIPRDFGFALESDLLVVGHQESNEITVFKRDKSFGRLVKMDGLSIEIPEIVCVTEGFIN
ncbi:lactonase family protein [Peptostreptococcus faecalis]|uniref:lactonase family protein n=1 Tax=Peptostreptococcus faecalis TaxID=2045015 RepID=UPI000C7A6C45|nr:lactonase family protein [Peptostreptococcus faecalis]